MNPRRILLLASLAALLGGCAACLPDAMKRDANASAAASGVIAYPGNPTPQPD
jgi:starvation-inducible outer membrane lipoprotein